MDLIGKWKNLPIWNINIFILTLSIFLIATVNANQVKDEENVTYDAYKIIEAIINNDPIVKSKIILYNRMDTILNGNSILELSENVDKSYYKCNFKVINNIFGKYKDDIFTIIDEGNFREKGTSLDSIAYFIIKSSEFYEIKQCIFIGRNKWTTISLVHDVLSIVNNKGNKFSKLNNTLKIDEIIQTIKNQTKPEKQNLPPEGNKE